MYVALELFSGSGNISKALKSVEIATFEVDNRYRKGTCEPDWKQDILKIMYPGLLNNMQKKHPNLTKINIVTLSIPCQKYSIAANGKHFTGTTPKTESALIELKLLRKSFQLLEAIKPDYYFIENPRGQLRYNKLMIDFLAKTGGMIKETSWGSYGFPTPKPTDIFTNCISMQLRQKAPFGRGNKSNKSFDNLTVVQRQSIPADYCIEFANFIKTLDMHPGIQKQ